MSRLVVLGAGGHAKVVADIAGRLGHEVAAYVDERRAHTSVNMRGAAIVDGLADVPGLPIALGIGDNRARLSRLRAIAVNGHEIMTLVHPSAVLASTVTLGTGVVVMAGVVVNSDVSVGDAAVLNTSCSIDHDCAIGDGVHICPGSHLAGGVTVGTGTFVGIGTNIIQLRNIGDWAVCGAGSVVVSDVPARRTVKGSPAR